METSIKSKNFSEIETYKEATLLTGKTLFDNWFSGDGGGIKINSAIYLSGTSGSGKTTLMVNLMKWLPKVKTSMYFREMEARSVKQQTKNLGEFPKNAYFADIKMCPSFESYMKELNVLKPKVIILDSLQVIAMEDFAMKGKMSEEQACYHIIKTLREWIAKNDAVLFLIGHNTKEGNFAGRNTLIQMMDAHIVMAYDKKDNSRKIEWGTKNRKGPMGKLFYDFTPEGIEFFTEDQWLTKTSASRNFITTVENAVGAYLDTMDRENENYATAKKEYKTAIRSIQEIEDDGERLVAYVALVNSLATKHGL